MQPLLTREESRRVDATLIAAGVPGIVLMENAGRGAAEATLALARVRGLRRVAVLVGPGNNGGDGLVVARHLALAGLAVEVYSIVDPSALRGDAATMRDAWLAIGGHVTVVDEADLAPGRPWEGDAAEVLVDGLFGTGLARPLAGAARAAIERANARLDRPLSIALDVPSGLDVDSGAPLGDAAGVFRATHTFTFGTSKPGLHTGHGCLVCGEVRVISLGAPLPAFVGQARAHLAQRRPLAARARDAHKGDNGHVLVVGGSEGKTGAALLCARGAHRAGAGLVTIATRTQTAIDAKVVETMSLALPDEPAAAVRTLGTMLPRYDAVAVGPGLGRDAWARAVLDAVLAGAQRVVIDADALGLLGERGVRESDAARVLTPHPLEMARLLGDPGGAAVVNADRLRAARECARRFGAIVVLKGAGTVIARPDGEVFLSPYAEPVLAVAGSGDVLAGAIAARLAERRPPAEFDEAVLDAVLAHGRAGERVRAERGSSRGALASEIADALSRALEDPG